jgi:hypothetical protein
LVIAEEALKALSWLLPEGKYDHAKEKAILLEQAARALVEACKRGHIRKLEQIARGHSNMQVLTSVDAVGTDGCKASPMVFAHINRGADGLD